MRFTLGKMFLAIAMLALACAGMKYGTYWWAGGISTLTLLLFGTAVVRAISESGRSRTVWASAAIIGIAYLVVASSRALHCEILFPSLAMAWFARTYEISYIPTLEPLSIQAYAFGGLGIQDTDFSHLKNFFTIGHCVWSWLFAVLAAWFAGRIYDRRERVMKEAT
jgi:hypothetical protein